MQPVPLLLDLVHHNPGEPPLATRFSDPAVLARLGYTGQVLKHLNACVAFPETADGAFPSTDEERVWLEKFAGARDAEIAAAKAAGLAVYYHVDLFVLPRRVVDAHAAEICDAQGRIDVRRPATIELHRRLLDGMFARFPAVEGVVVRVGETYLFDTPFHVGNTAVPLHDPAVDRAEQMRRFILLLHFLREEVCERHGRTLIFRTWDYFTDRFHADPEFYETVTAAIEPHPRLLFSIKHTAGDFFRGCRPNPCLGRGVHPQLVEVQCQREYEGKGAYPNYIARGVIDGFAEVPAARGLRGWRAQPTWAGLWTWSRGGGWFGPYLAHEFWCDLNVRVLAAWMRDPDASENALFGRVCAEVHGLDATDTARLRELCRLAEEAVWRGRSVPAMAELQDYRCPDFAGDSGQLWMRDDRLGGMEKLSPIFAALEAAGKLDQAVAEKEAAAGLFAVMPRLAERIHFRDAATREAVVASAHYGARLFAIVAQGWTLLVQQWRAQHGRGQPPSREAREAHRRLWADYRRLPSEMPACATLYTGNAWSWPGNPAEPGLEAAVLGPAKR